MSDYRPPPHEPTDETRARVREVLAAGGTRPDAAAAIGISDDTLRRRYAEVLAEHPPPQGQPPEGRRFRPGESGNPGGMSSTAGQALTVARAESAEMVRVLAGIAKDGGQSGPARVAAAKEVLDRALGKAPATVNINADFGRLDDDGLDTAIRERAAAELAALGISLAGIAGDDRGEGEADAEAELPGIRY